MDSTGVLTPDLIGSPQDDHVFLNWNNERIVVGKKSKSGLGLRFGEIRVRGPRLIGIQEHFNFRAKAHAAIAIGIGTRVHQASAAVGLIGLVAGNLRRHFQCRFNGHADLQGRGSDEEKPTTRKIDGFGEMIGFVRGQAQGTEAQGDTKGKALELSAFRRGHDHSVPGEGWAVRGGALTVMLRLTER